MGFHRIAPGRRPPDPPPTGAILRYHVPRARRGQHLDELLRTCADTGAREVMLFTSHYCGEAVFVAGAALERRLDHLAWCAGRIRAAGLGFHLNVMHTLGHLHVPADEIRRFGFARQLQADGAPGRNPVLDPACPRLGDHLERLYGRYASALAPDLIFVDDDYHVPPEQVYHPGRLARFALRAGCPASAEAVAALLASPEPARRDAARTLMWSLVSDDLIALAERLRRAVAAVAPAARLGLMHGMPFADVAGIAKALAGPQRPAVRPQLPCYREQGPLREYPQAWWLLSYWQARLPPDVEIFPECESYPYTPWLKSAAAALAHAAACRGAGGFRLALSVNSFTGRTPACESRALPEAFRRQRGQAARLHRLFAGQPVRRLGAGFWNARPGPLFGCAPGNPPGFLLATGLPLVGARSPEEAALHWGEDLGLGTAEERVRVAAAGAFLDLESAQALARDGLLAGTGLALGAPLEAIPAVSFRRMDGGREDWPLHYFLSRALEREAYPRALASTGGRALATFTVGRTPFLLCWRSPAGRPFALLNAFTRRWPQACFSNPWMPGLLARAIAWVRPGSLPAVACCQAATSLQVLAAGDGRHLLTLVNLGSDAATGLGVRLNGRLRTAAWQELAATGRLTALPPPRRGLLLVPGSTPALGTRLLVSAPLPAG